MGGSPVFKIAIKSKINNYKVEFTDNYRESLDKNLKKNDIILIDKAIDKIYPEIAGDLKTKNKLIKIIANEKQKSFRSLIPVINRLIKSGFRKNHRLVGIGGGVAQDITAFIASIMFRGVDWIFFPTTLLAQGDSCIGSKTSINFEQYKIKLVVFIPKKIFISLDFLKSLPPEQMQSGFGEMCHYFIVSGEKDFKNYLKIMKMLSKVKAHYQGWCLIVYK